MKNILDTLADFDHEDLLTIKVALNKEIKHTQEMIEKNERVELFDYVEIYKQRKEVLNKFWDALIDYELER